MPPATTCPNCNAVLVPARPRCISCGMEVAKMADYRRAMAAAGKRGHTAVKIERAPRTGMALPNLKPFFAIAVALLVIGGIYYLLSITVLAKAQPWLAYPTAEEAAVRGYFAFIGTDQKPQHLKAYALVSQLQKDPKNDNESGNYLQFYHDIHRYFAAEFGDDWAAQLTLSATPGKAHDFAVQVGPAEAHETIHVQLADQSPAGQPPRWGIAGIDELDIDSPTRMKSREGTYGAMRMLGAGGAVGALKGIAGTFGNFQHETPMETKMRLFPLVKDPRAAQIDFSVMQLWKVRNDPYARYRLGQIAGDGRYGDITRARAKAVLDGTLSEEDRIAAHVEEN